MHHRLPTQSVRILDQVDDVRTDLLHSRQLLLVDLLSTPIYHALLGERNLLIRLVRTLDHLPMREGELGRVLVLGAGGVLDELGLQLALRPHFLGRSGAEEAYLLLGQLGHTHLLKGKSAHAARLHDGRIVHLRRAALCQHDHACPRRGLV